jgi:hypothetical protein
MSDGGFLTGGWQQSRRRFLRGAAASVGVASIAALDRIGGAAPAEADAPVCSPWPAGFQFRGGVCVPSAYPTDCNKGGCYRSGIQSSPANCPSNGAVYKERHRTCGEERIINGHEKRFALRLNDCGGDYDGWEWIGTDASPRCGCPSPQRILWSCNDGWLATRQGTGWGEYVPSICMTGACWSG